jgi:hypothetical protein
MTRKLKDISIVPAQPADREPVVALLAAQMAEHRTRSQNAKLSRMYEQILADERYGFLLVGKAGCEIVGVAYVATILSTAREVESRDDAVKQHKLVVRIMHRPPNTHNQLSCWGFAHRRI